MKNVILLFFALVLISPASLAQLQGQARLDSLLAELPKQNEDTNKVKTLCRIGIEYYQIEPQEGLRFGNRVLDLSQQLKYKLGIGNGYSILSCCYAALANYPLALDYGFKCLQVMEELKEADGTVKALDMIGGIYNSQKDYDQAIAYKEKALAKAIADGQSGRRFIANLGVVYHNKGDYKKSLEYCRRDLELCRQENNPMAEVNAIGNMGGAHIRLGNFKDGMDCLFQSLAKAREFGNKTYIAYSYRYLGRAFSMLANDTNAVALKEMYNGNRPLVLKLGGLYIDSALTMAIASGSLSQQSDSYKTKSEILKLQGNYKLSLENFERHVVLKDSIFNKDKSSKITQLSMQYEFDKKVAAEKARHDKEVEVARAEVQKQRVIRNSSLAGTLGILLFAGFSFYNFQRRRQLEKMQALAIERLRISRELHDDVGSALGSIALYSDVAISRSVKKESASDVLLKIGNASRELVEKMSDIIWSMNPDNENMDKLTTRMKAFGSSLLAPMQINIQYEFDAALQKISLPGDQMKNLFLIYKEAIYNIAKYAECRNVDIGLKLESDRIVMLIKDDGRGFDPSSAKSAYNGNGLKNMNARTVLLNGIIHIDSKPVLGTRIELSVPVALAK